MLRMRRKSYKYLYGKENTRTQTMIREEIFIKEKKIRRDQHDSNEKSMWKNSKKNIEEMTRKEMFKDIFRGRKREREKKLENTWKWGW